tara:strand:- start:43 stop:1203 length:1161 start_codon:yes stop_codon:yes gene_type:complete
MKFPDIGTERTEDYALLIGANFDTLQESFNVSLPEKLVERLEYGKQLAIEEHEGQGRAFGFGGEVFQIWSGASQGNKWVIENDDFQIHFGPASRGWPVQVRYLSAGLWEHGARRLKDRVVRMLEKETDPIYTDTGTVDDWCNVTRADYALDFYSPELSKEMRSKTFRHSFLLTSGVKMGVVGPSSKDETITIGMNRKTLVIQIYDKGQEIKDRSGKNWMRKIWEKNGFFMPEGQEFQDIWRLEVRFGKDYLKERNMRKFDDFEAELPKLMSEALMRRRAVISNDMNRARCDLHPFWAEAFHAAGAAREYVPIGRQITMAREEYIDMLLKQQAGLGRSLVIASDKKWNKHKMARHAHEAIKLAEDDPLHENKVKKAFERQRFMCEAQ